MKTAKTKKSPSAKTNAKIPVASMVEREQSLTVAPAEIPATVAKPTREITTDLIAARAYTIWEQQGRPQGKDLQNWLLAETQLKQEVQSFTA